MERLPSVRRHRDRATRDAARRKHFEAIAGAFRSAATASKSQLTEEDLEGLVHQLHDHDEQERWKAANSLIEAGSRAVRPMLRDIERTALGERLRDSYRYVFRHEPASLSRRLSLLNRALASDEFRTEAPIAAARVLRLFLASS